MKIIVGVDDSPCSEAAIRYVASVPWPKDARFTVVSAVRPILPGADEAASLTVIEEVLREQEKHHRRVADRAAATLRTSGLQSEVRATRGDPREVLEEEASAQKADLIVLGSHGRSGLTKLLLGSVASHVVTHAPCSVLIVKESKA